MICVCACAVRSSTVASNRFSHATRAYCTVVTPQQAWSIFNRPIEEKANPVLPAGSDAAAGCLPFFCQSQNKKRGLLVLRSAWWERGRKQCHAGTLPLPFALKARKPRRWTQARPPLLCLCVCVYVPHLLHGWVTTEPCSSGVSYLDKFCQKPETSATR